MTVFFFSRISPLLARWWRKRSLPYGAAAGAALLLGGCASHTLDRAPASPDVPWVGTVPGQMPEAGTPAEQAPGFSIPAIAALRQIDPGPVLDAEQPLGLAQLIDIAQRENPDTRQAWHHARQAALAIGMVEATFLPMISANVLAGHQRTSRPSPLIIGPSDIDTDISGVAPSLTLGWLLFDFGGRRALADGAEQVSFAANVLFNAMHQKVIRDVTDQYYQYDVSRARVRLAQEALGNHQQVAQAVQARLRAGVGTTVEQAVARQAVAQAQLRLVNAQGIERNVYLTLLRAIGLPPDTKLNIAAPQTQALPASSDPMTMQLMTQALAQRPDVAAAYAATKAAEAGVRAVESEFLPRVFLAAVAGKRHTQFDIVGLPSLSQSASSGTVLLQVSLPLFDGGLRSARVRQAEIRRDEAAQALQTRQRDALREMVAAETMLQSALQSHDSAQELVRTAQTAYDATLDAYKVGMGTITLATEAATNLLDARQARTDAHAASLIAAANLAFAMGDMTRPRDRWMPPAPTTGARP